VDRRDATDREKLGLDHFTVVIATEVLSTCRWIRSPREKVSPVD
jgi:hypothetical protein